MNVKEKEAKKSRWWRQGGLRKEDNEKKDGGHNGENKGKERHLEEQVTRKRKPVEKKIAGRCEEEKESKRNAQYA